MRLFVAAHTAVHFNSGQWMRLFAILLFFYPGLKAGAIHI
jgi:hypothetical protein